MCGICGIVDTDVPCEAIAPFVRQMVAVLRHRGPNNQDIAMLGPAVLGHTRLSILDLSDAANQPMHSLGERYSVVFNGEIYNFKELRKQLQRAGKIFRTTSDTEVLLNLYEVYGVDCVSKLAGMFAFAIWDTAKHTLFLARDRFGQKPLYYHSRNNRFTFASEIQSLLCDTTIDRCPNLPAIYHYLTVQSVPAPLSAFSGVAKLGAGECLLLEGNTCTTWRYWKPDFTGTFTGTGEEAVEELDHLLTQAVDTHLESDVPLGLFLSGGVDSSLITAIACKQRGDMRSFSMGFAESAFDERPFAKQVASYCGTLHYDETASEDLCGMLPALVRNFGEPFGDSSAIPCYLLSQMTSAHVTVALSGDGGDDLFGGYERFLDPFVFPTQMPQDDRLVERYSQLRECVATCKGEQYNPEMLNAATVAYFFHWARLCGQRKAQLCTDALRNAALPNGSLMLMLDRFTHSSCCHLLDKIQEFELDYYLAATLMPKIDISSMSASLEVRAPFLDNAVGDFALSLPVNMRVRTMEDIDGGCFGKGFEPKWVVKKVAEKYLPDHIIYRRKKGFGVPLAKWLRNGLKELLLDTLHSSACRSRGWIRPDILQTLLNEHLAQQQEHHQGLWTLLMLELWAQEFFPD